MFIFMESRSRALGLNPCWRMGPKIIGHFSRMPFNAWVYFCTLCRHIRLHEQLEQTFVSFFTYFKSDMFVYMEITTQTIKICITICKLILLSINKKILKEQTIKLHIYRYTNTITLHKRPISIIGMYSKWVWWRHCRGQHDSICTCSI